MRETLAAIKRVTRTIQQHNMKSIICIFLLFIELNNLYSQNIDLKQLTEWREKSYEIVDVSLSRYGWKKFNRSTNTTCRNSEYILYKSLENQQTVRLMYTDDYKIENNSLSYNALKDWKYDHLVADLKSSGYKILNSYKNKKGTSDHYRLDNNSVIVSIYKRKNKHLKEEEFYTVYVSRE